MYTLNQYITNHPHISHLLSCTSWLNQNKTKNHNTIPYNHTYTYTNTSTSIYNTAISNSNATIATVTSTPTRTPVDDNECLDDWIYISGILLSAYKTRDVIISLSQINNCYLNIIIQYMIYVYNLYSRRSLFICITLLETKATMY